jgi:hypothetical protein
LFASIIGPRRICMVEMLETVSRDEVTRKWIEVAETLSDWAGEECILIVAIKNMSFELIRSIKGLGPTIFAIDRSARVPSTFVLLLVPLQFVLPTEDGF